MEFHEILTFFSSYPLFPHIFPIGGTIEKFYYGAKTIYYEPKINLLRKRKFTTKKEFLLGGDQFELLGTI